MIVWAIPRGSGVKPPGRVCELALQLFYVVHQKYDNTCAAFR
jgi:hypothetical protein